MLTVEQLKYLQSLSLEEKIQISSSRGIEWYETWGGAVVLQFSGGKDSTVMTDLLRRIYPNIKAVYSDTGLEYPEIKSFVKTFDNITIIKPEKNFRQVIYEYGYPLITKEIAEAIFYARKNQKTVYKTSQRKRQELLGKVEGLRAQFNKRKYLPLCNLPIPISHYCCNVMKKLPMTKFNRQTKLKPYIGIMASESRMRKQAWLRHGCNAFNSKKKTSQPLAFWTEQDILEYIVKYGIKIAKPYGEICRDKDGKLKCSGCDRTGCIWCPMGFHLEKGETRFQRLAKTHPQIYDYCMRGGEWIDNPAYDESVPKYDGDWENWNPKKIWVPSTTGLGMRKVFDMVNEIYGKDFYRYD